jgi:hypothetical protein
MLALDLGANNCLTLQKEVVEALQDKESCGTSFWSDFQGNDYLSQSYLIPRMHISGVAVERLIANTANPYFEERGSLIGGKRMRVETIRQGSIGREGMMGVNWFFDLRRAAAYMVSDVSLLKESGYSVDRFVRVPFCMEQVGIVFDAVTDVGPKRFLLDSGASYSLLRSSTEESDPLTLHVRLGTKEIGDLEFVPFSPPSFASSIDGILGANFLEACVLFLDFHKQEAYLGDPSRPEWAATAQPYFSLPVRIDDASGFPFIEVQVGKKRCLVRLHGNRPDALSLRQDVLSAITPKRPAGILPWENRQGERQESALYLIPELRLGGARIRGVMVSEDIDVKEDGIIGYGLLSTAHWLWDIGGGALYASQDATSLIQKMERGYVQMPFTFSPYGVLLHVETQQGVKQFLLAPSRRTSAVNAESPSYSASPLLFQERIAERLSLKVESFPPLLHRVDGAFGLDFLMDHAVCLDTARFVAYVSKRKDHAWRKTSSGGREASSTRMRSGSQRAA